MRHLVHTLRKLARTPGFTLLSILTLALGIAATTAIFSVVNGVLLRPLPHPQPEGLMVTSHDAPGLNLHGFGLSEALYFYYRAEGRTLEELALVDDQAATVTGSGTPERLRATVATASFFKVLRTSPALGRAFVDHAGRLHQELGSAAQSVIFIVAGLPVVLKNPNGEPTSNGLQA